MSFIPLEVSGLNDMVILCVCAISVCIIRVFSQEKGPLAGNQRSFKAFLHFLTAFQCPGEGDLVRVFQLAAHRNTIGKSCDANFHGP